jgi:hypothetical protein
MKGTVRAVFASLVASFVIVAAAAVLTPASGVDRAAIARLLEADAHLLDAPTAKLIHGIVEDIVPIRRLPGVSTDEAQRVLKLIDAAIHATT